MNNWKYDFYECLSKCNERTKVKLPEDINSMIIDIVVNELECPDFVGDIKNIQENWCYGELKIAPNKIPNAVYVFKHQNGMFLTWDSIFVKNKKSGAGEIKVTHKNTFIKIERRKKYGGQDTDNGND